VGRCNVRFELRKSREGWSEEGVQLIITLFIQIALAILWFFSKSLGMCHVLWQIWEIYSLLVNSFWYTILEIPSTQNWKALLEFVPVYLPKTLLL